MSDRRCIVLDMDDTLYLERQYVWSGFQAVQTHLLTRINAEHFAEIAWSEFLKGRRGDTFDAALTACGLRPTRSLISEMVEVYRSHTPAISLLPDALDFLKAAKPRFKLGLLTDGPIHSQRAKALALSLESWCDAMVFTAELGVGCGKPHPAGFRFIEQYLNCSGPSCVYIGDNPMKDFVAPHAMKWKTIRIRRKDSLHESIKSRADVDAEIQSLAELQL